MCVFISHIQHLQEKTNKQKKKQQKEAVNHDYKLSTYRIVLLQLDVKQLLLFFGFLDFFFFFNQ